MVDKKKFQPDRMKGLEVMRFLKPQILIVIHGRILFVLEHGPSSTCSLVGRVGIKIWRELTDH